MPLLPTPPLLLVCFLQMWRSWLYWIILNYGRSFHYYPQNKTCIPLHAISSWRGDKTFKWFKLTLLHYRIRCKSFDAATDLFNSNILIGTGLEPAYPHAQMNDLETVTGGTIFDYAVFLSQSVLQNLFRLSPNSSIPWWAGILKQQ